VLPLHVVLRHAGVLEMLPMMLLQCAKQNQWQQQQQQQPAEDDIDTFGCTAVLIDRLLLSWQRMLSVPKATDEGGRTAATVAASVPLVVPFVLPLLQQLQRCAPLLLALRPETGYANSQIQGMHMKFLTLQAAASSLVFMQQAG
jgi:hypothetical protein